MNNSTKTINEYGTIRWLLNDKFHRENGPAVEFINGNKFWYINNLLHREDGPAVECGDGCREYWYNDIRYPAIKTDKKWLQLMKLINFK